MYYTFLYSILVFQLLILAFLIFKTLYRFRFAIV